VNNRRKLLVALGAGALAAPFVSFAQPQTAKVARIGYLGLSSTSSYAGGVEALRASLRDLGYVEGKNLVMESRWAEGNNDRLPELAAELVRLKVDIIVATQTPAVQAAKRATNTIPIVMAPAGDPVGTGIIASLARPGGNVTGLSAAISELAAKNLEFIREISPSVRRVAVLANKADPFTKPFLEHIELAGRSLGIKLQTMMISGEEEFDAAFTEMVRMRVDAVIVQGSLPRKRAVDLALKHRLLAVAAAPGFAEAGGLMSYVGVFTDLYREAAVYVDKILKGAKPSDLPVQQPTRFELVINLKTAKQIGLKIPPNVLARADKVIE
jgi:putative ABC transport system substrate-binding protein